MVSPAATCPVGAGAGSAAMPDFGGGGSGVAEMPPEEDAPGGGNSTAWTAPRPAGEPCGVSGMAPPVAGAEAIMVPPPSFAPGRRRGWPACTP